MVASTLEFPGPPQDGSSVEVGDEVRVWFIGDPGQLDYSQTLLPALLLTEVSMICVGPLGQDPPFQGYVPYLSSDGQGLAERFLGSIIVPFYPSYDLTIVGE
jgi:hypothetical protein